MVPTKEKNTSDQTEIEMSQFLCKCINNEDGKNLYSWNEFWKNHYLKGFSEDVCPNFDIDFIIDIDLIKAIDEKNIPKIVVDFNNKKINNFNLNVKINEQKKSTNNEKLIPIFNFIFFKNLDVINSTIKDIDFRYASFENVTISNSNLTDCSFSHSNLTKKCSLKNSTLKGVGFNDAILNDTDLSYTIMDEGTTLGYSDKNKDLPSSKYQVINYVNEKFKDTDFTGVRISRVTVNPLILSRLERNIRKKNWDNKYDWKSNKKNTEENENNPEENENNPEEHENLSFFQKIESSILKPISKIFWFFSDYGYSTMRIVFSLIIVNIIFGSIYFFCCNFHMIKIPFLVDHMGYLETILQSMILGFSTIGIISSPYGMESLCLLIVFLHLLTVNFLIAALITRFAVMFNNTYP